MHRLLPAAAAAMALLSAPALHAQEQPAKPDPVAELARLIARYETASDKPRAAAELRPEFEAFAHDNTGSEPGLTARLWLLNSCWWLRTNESSVAMNEAADKVVEQILAEYVDNAQFEKIADYHYVFAADKKTPLFERLLKSKYKTVRASTLLRIGMLDKGSKDETVRARANERLETLLRDYADVPKGTSTYGALADAHLHPLAAADLAIGKPAPEITGVNTDGKPMKLSDFRGKVLVVDFWGFW
jgi:hypothetical protein